MNESGAGKLLAILLGALTLMMAAWPGGTAAAQGQIEVTDSRAVLRFPDTITFELEVSAPAEIVDITLTYGTNARSCQSGGSRQKVQFDAGDEVQTEWEWELKRSGSIPPGSLIWWTWTVEDAAGNSITTEQEELAVTDERHNWRSVANDGVSVNWYSGDEAFGSEVLAITVSELARLSAEIGVEVPENVQMWLYPTASDVREALVTSADWTGAVAFSDYQTMIISLAPGQASWAAEVIPHELTHLVVGAATHNCRGGYLPVWLSEGLAVYGEGAISAGDIEQLEDALEDERLPALRALADGFSAYGSGAHLAYTQSGEVVRFMLEEYGPEQMDALLLAVRDGLAIDRALEQVLGFDTDELDARWRLAQGYQATPTSEASQALEDATPTAVPTVALVGVPVFGTPTAPPATATETPRPTPTVTQPPPTVEAEPSLTAAGETVAEAVDNESATSAPSPAAPAGGGDEPSASPLPWIAGIGLGLVILSVAGYLVLRKGE